MLTLSIGRATVGTEASRSEACSLDDYYCSEIQCLAGNFATRLLSLPCLLVWLLFPDLGTHVGLSVLSQQKLNGNPPGRGGNRVHLLLKQSLPPSVIRVLDTRLVAACTYPGNVPWEPDSKWLDPVEQPDHAGHLSVSFG
ncbi:hypothetical protein VFPPC_15979 [Pochonia chlamydosporia 170]|uniref:Uncharacterized protein n=1 Tax=Pochonia chlamydosporia 170 TaxID=1380566 RepID=A0A179FKE8_METCM|nr:hypothetical protein VFPPC_15979 [Pochonia chlamydosporia 170]OAQ66052.1 hypothetical protein VFPPC_15979 [Pochonia chlamydosporia 170]